MSLVVLKPRPLTRDVSSLRDDRLFIVACDDTYAPSQYFNFFRLPRVKVHVVPTQDSTSVASHVLTRLLEYEHQPDDELWLLLDTDHVTRGTHLQNFTAALKEAKQKGVHVALSRPCFEFWLLLHHAEGGVEDLPNASAVEAALRQYLGEYNKTRLKKDHFPVKAVASAFRRAELLDGLVDSGEIPGRNTSRVYQLWRSILAKSLPTQIPAELRELL
jgi:hypothetical protein